MPKSGSLSLESLKTFVNLTPFCFSKAQPTCCSNPFSSNTSNPETQVCPSTADAVGQKESRFKKLQTPLSLPFFSLFTFFLAFSPLFTQLSFTSFLTLFPTHPLPTSLCAERSVFPSSSSSEERLQSSQRRNQSLLISCLEKCKMWSLNFSIARFPHPDTDGFSNLRKQYKVEDHVADQKLAKESGIDAL